MNVRVLALCCVMLVAAAASAPAGQKADKAVPSRKPALPPGEAVASKPGSQALGTQTGSYIPHRIHRSGVVTDGGSPLYIVDRDTLNQSGAATLRDALARRGFSR